jgi:hypothetical protein
MDLIGNGAAAEYVGIAERTWSAYVARDRAPKPATRVIQGGHALPVWTRQQLDEWKANRPGRGAPGRPRRKAA